MRDLSSLTNQQLQDFLNSFDYVLSDVDGVLWNLLETIPGTQDAITSLKKIGKKVIFVSNNTTKSLRAYHRELKNAGFDVDEAEIVTPTLAIVDYLKKHGFIEKEIFLLGMTALRKSLEREGFKLAQNGPDRIKERLADFAANSIVDDGKVAAVIADVDVNINYVNLQKAATFLERPEVLFLKGPTDMHLPVGKNQKRVMIGPGYFTNILEDITGRKGLLLSKPGPLFNDYIVEKFKISDPKKVLFIGDSVPSDMTFASACNYRKLLVLSGLTKKEEVEKWKFPSECKPDYYADSLKVVNECILRSFSSKL